MRHHQLSRRSLLKVSVGGAAVAWLNVPARAFARQNAELAYQGPIEFWDWEFAPRQAR